MTDVVERMIALAQVKAFLESEHATPRTNVLAMGLLVTCLALGSEVTIDEALEHIKPIAQSAMGAAERIRERGAADA